MFNLKHLLAILINTPLRKIGYEICHYADSHSLQAALARTVTKTQRIGTVIDVGASDGRWSAVARRFYPDAYYFLIEANRAHEAKLHAFCSKMQKADYILAAAGDVVGEVYFDGSNLFGGQASHVATQAHSMSVPVTTVDHEVATRQLKRPFLLKLDTHGFEVPIFQGAEATLQNTDLIVVEVYNFDVARDSLRFHEICSFLNEYGFRPIDLCGPLHRPSDKSLWKFDLLFIPANCSAFSYDDYI